MIARQMLVFWDQSWSKNLAASFLAFLWFGVGEHSIIPPAGAIANAIHDAVGVRLNSMPMAPHKVRAAIAAKQAAL